MKYFIISLLIAASAAIRISGIDDKDLMQEQPSHWRKRWPEGDIDDGQDDEGVLDGSGLPEWPAKKVKKREVFPAVVLDEDVITTQENIEKVEKKKNLKLSDEAVKDGGMGMIFTYDNTKRQYERNTPYGMKWEGNK